MFAMTIGQRNVRTEPLIHPGSCVSLKSKNQDGQTMDPMEDRGDILLRGVYKTGQDVIVDVRVTNTDSVSYRGRSPEKVIESQEKQKKKKYLEGCLQQRRSFVPFVCSVDGLLGREARSLLKQLSLLLSDKWQK